MASHLSEWEAYRKEMENRKALRERVKRKHNKARRRGALGRLSIGRERSLYQLQRGKCPICKERLGQNWHLDHIVPIALGGSNTDENVQLLCPTCNLAKNAKHPVEFMQSKGFLL